MTLLGEEVCYVTLCSGGCIMAWHAQCGVIWLSAPDTGRVNIFLERRLQCQLEATHHISFPIIELKITSKGNQYNMSRLQPYWQQMKSHVITITIANVAVIKVTLRMMIVIVGGADTLLTMLSHGGHLLTRRPPDSSTQRK